DGLRGVTGMKFDRYPWVLSAKFGEYFVKKAVAGCDRAINAELPVQLFCFGKQRFLISFPLLDHLFSKYQKSCPLMSQGHGAVVTLKKADSKTVFQLLDITAQS